jgi:uncharacterized protein (TIGR03790 family)
MERAAAENLKLSSLFMRFRLGFLAPLLAAAGASAAPLGCSGAVATIDDAAGDDEDAGHDASLGGDGSTTPPTSSDSGPDAAPGAMEDGGAGGGDDAGDAGATDGSSGAGDAGDAAVSPAVLPTGSALTADELAVIVNVDDPDSVAIGAYYAQKRGLPAANVISVHVPSGASITSAQFAPVKSAVDAATPAGVQAYALAFTQPYEVQCMSITSAFAFGFDTKWCNTSGMTCGATAESPYFQQESHTPFTDFGLRPTMMLAGAARQDVLDLIDRGVAADDTYPEGTDYLVITSDADRSVRAGEFEELAASWDAAGTGVKTDLIDNSAGKAMDFISNETDVLFYFTGLASVPDIATNTYRPGALADHLTSYGGQVPTSGQMSAVAWLKAGATASYGTVLEPCNFTAKFPDPHLAVPRYYRGGTALEAYWTSVEWPGEGLFIGEPLAAPWAKPVVTFANDTLTITTTWLNPGHTYRLEGSNGTTGPFTTVQDGITVTKVDPQTFTVLHPAFAYYRFTQVS